MRSRLQWFVVLLVTESGELIIIDVSSLEGPYEAALKALAAFRTSATVADRRAATVIFSTPLPKFEKALAEWSKYSDNRSV